MVTLIILLAWISIETWALIYGGAKHNGCYAISGILAELKKGENQPNVILSIELDSGTVKWGESSGGFDDVQSMISNVSSLQNKIDQKKGYSSRGQITFQILGRNNFKTLIKDEYLKNRRVTRYDGFVRKGFTFADYAATFTGVINRWTRHGDVLTITVTDDLVEGLKEIPVENDTKTQSIDYTNSGAGQNPVDVMQDILVTQLSISTTLIDDTQFDSEQELWLNSWLVSRVITEPQNANIYLNELQADTNSFIVNDGEKITYKVFAPPLPGTSVEKWSDGNEILEDSMQADSGYVDAFFNRIVIRYDYDESGSDEPQNFDSVIILADADSQGAGEWNEVRTKTVNSKWIKSFTHDNTSTVTGVTVYHVSKANGGGSGSLAFDQTANTLTWTAPSGSVGAAVELSKDGKYDVFDADLTKFIRVVVNTANLDAGNQTDTITITAIPGSSFATSVANKYLSKWRNPSTGIKFKIDINNVASGSNFIKPTDLKDLTTDDASEKGDSSWADERIMITSVRPDFENDVVEIEAVESKLYNRYGFICSTGFPDYTSATDSQKEYCFIGSTANLVGGVKGYYIW